MLQVLHMLGVPKMEAPKRDRQLGASGGGPLRGGDGQHLPIGGGATQLKDHLEVEVVGDNLVYSLIFQLDLHLLAKEPKFLWGL
jgi:hypothetical protein